jgi:hypothetical protein
MFLCLLIALFVMPASLWAAENETVDLDMVTQIRQEGFRHSQAMLLLSELTDRLGARVTGSPSLKKANEWSRDKLTEWGLTNPHLESWPFGRGWESEFTSVRMVAPDTAMLWALPRAWTPGTNGTVRGKVVRVSISGKQDLEKYKGKLAGTIIVMGSLRQLKPETEPPSMRITDAQLTQVTEYAIPRDSSAAGASAGSTGPGNSNGGSGLSQALMAQFFVDEKVLAVVEPSMYDEGLVTVSGTKAYRAGETVGVPVLNMAIEHYGRISRLLDRNVSVELEMNVQNRFVDDDTMAYNTIAEIPGTDKKDEIVMLGGHIDSWHGGTGATDNAAGVAACMEAVRILKALGVKPRRTIRIGLWSGEEQGLLGSRAYVAQHFAARPEPSDPKEKQMPVYLRRSGALQFKPEYKKLAAYFNIDNGGGKFRGIFAQDNAAVRPIFQAWIEPFHDLGVRTVTMRTTGGTDHLSFDGVGLPGFQFLQDPLDYMAHTHHSNMDVYERVVREDLMQQAVVMAWFVYNAAMREQPLPRKPMPVEEKPSSTQKVAQKAAR